MHLYGDNFEHSVSYNVLKTSGLILHCMIKIAKTKGKRKVQGVPRSQTAALSRHQEEEETDKSKQAQIEQTYEKY